MLLKCRGGQAENEAGWPGWEQPEEHSSLLEKSGVYFKGSGKPLTSFK